MKSIGTFASFQAEQRVAVGEDAQRTRRTARSAAQKEQLPCAGHLSLTLQPALQDGERST